MYLDIEKFGVNRRGLLSRLTFQRPKATARFALYLQIHLPINCMDGINLIN